ncbi:hypothetical protein NQ314_015971 [Rhamnusium bicolor]|uniref:Uncharacterized protein n=1 Tax=Rhamnusium bicolor TaxID=1586634 RepID=A0AAV8WXC6_9CUCU|nr:hypothetical protein NQ314_015971 [Rhamnusium bicolor]
MSLLQEIFNFFTASTLRWKLLQDKMILTQTLKGGKEKALTVKGLSATRWSSRSEVCRSIYESWNDIQRMLLYI